MHQGGCRHIPQFGVALPELFAIQKSPPPPKEIQETHPEVVSPKTPSAADDATLPAHVLGRAGSGQHLGSTDPAGKTQH